MKKCFKVLAIAAVASLTIVACNNNNKPAEPEADTTAVEQVVAEEIVAEPAEVLDTTPVVEEKVVATAKKVVKQTTKKAAEQTEIKVNEDINNSVNNAEKSKKLESADQKASKLKSRRR